MMASVDVREFDLVEISGFDSYGVWHDEMVGTVGNVNQIRRSDDGTDIKVWPHDEMVGANDSGRVYFDIVDVRRLVVVTTNWLAE